MKFFFKKMGVKLPNATQLREFSSGSLNANKIILAKQVSKDILVGSK